MPYVFQNTNSMCFLVVVDLQSLGWQVDLHSDGEVLVRLPLLGIAGHTVPSPHVAVAGLMQQG